MAKNFTLGLLCTRNISVYTKMSTEYWNKWGESDRTARIRRDDLRLRISNRKEGLFSFAAVHSLIFIKTVMVNNEQAILQSLMLTLILLKPDKPFLRV